MNISKIIYYQSFKIFNNNYYISFIFIDSCKICSITGDQNYKRVDMIYMNNYGYVVGRSVRSNS